MKFNERLIKLRKAKGLSQEELGYELNVTRQTISKWELGESTPEMEKLIQISNFFGISVDELISNTNDETSSKNYNKECVGVDEKYIPNDMKNDTSYVNANKGSKKMMAIPIVVMIFPIIIFIISFAIMFGMQKNARDRMNKMQEKSTEIIDKSTNMVNTMIEKSNIEDNNVVNDEDDTSEINNSDEIVKQQETPNMADFLSENTEEIIKNTVEAYQNRDEWNDEDWSSRQEEIQSNFDKMKSEYEQNRELYESYFQNY